MNDFLGARAQTLPGGRADMAVDAGLRSFMLGVFNKMAVGLVVSGILAYIVGNFEPVTKLVLGTPIAYVVMFAPLVLLMVGGFAMKNPSPAASGGLYWAIVCLIGLGLGAVFLRYTDASVYKTFFVTAAAFGGLSLWGYTTKKDLTGFGVFLTMALIGLIIASLVQFGLMAFTKIDTSMLSFAISALGVLVFSGLTAYDTQRLKYTYYEVGGDQRSMAVATNYGALSLYLNFINLFQFLLSFLGSRE